jgi:RHS repeat-associated protein
MRSMRAAAVGAALVVGAAWPGGGLAQTTLTRTSSFAYSGSTGLLTQEVVEPNTPSLRLETDYSYDAFGNKIQVTTSGVDITTRSSSASFAAGANGSANGQFQTSTTNALSQSETWQYDLRFGKPTSHTGPNGLTTTWQYDTFGRKTLEVRPDGTQTAWSYNSCSSNTAVCSDKPNTIYYVFQLPLAANGSQNGPCVLIFYDNLDRELYRFTQGFDGSWITVQTVYDGLGRVQKKSRPYFFYANPQQPEWTTYSYDVFARVTTESLPDGHTIQHGYHGLVTTDTNQNNQTRTVTKNSQGQVASVADAQNNVTTYYYDPFGNLVQTVDATGKNVVVATYDLRGRKIASSDPDLGAWSYSYNTLGQLVSQTDAKSQTSQLTYDLLGRLSQRVEADMTATWTYDAQYIGKLASTSATGSATVGGGFQRNLSYDSLGRPVQVSTVAQGYTIQYSATYDGNSRLSTVRYHTGFTVQYNYTSLGYVQQVVDATSGQVYWTANQRDAELHLTQDTAGNSIVTARAFDAPTGRLTTIVAGTSNAVANFSYSYDGVGNLLTRADGNTGVSEGFGYDSLNRLVESSVTASGDPVAKYFGYDSVGNLLLKSDVGNYAYPEPGLAHPHGVLSIDGEGVTATFSYDANGNQTGATGIGRTVTYNAANKPATITQGALTLSFADDVDHQRYQQTVMQGSTTTTTHYFDAFGVHAEPISYSTGAWQWNDYIMVSGSMVGMRIWRSDGSVSFRYFHQDHLGSIAVVTDENGALAEPRDAYDPWGKRRFANGNDDPTGSITSLTSRGFTGQEMLASVGLVHLNGRVYDPFIGRMLSADPVVGDPLNGQTWNRYSYVWNNPLAFTDPTGYCPICVGTFFSRVGNGIGKFLQRNPLVGQALVIASAAVCTIAGGGPVCAGIASSVTNFVVTGLSTGSLDMALKASIVTAATAAAFYGVGEMTGNFAGVLDPQLGGHGPLQFGSDAHLFNIAGHALVGCGASVASGGKCGSGALSGAIPSLAGPIVNKLPFQAALVANTTLGGLASVAGGGKFANGAVTGAFGYLFNAEGKKGGGKGTIAVDILLWAITPTAANEGDFVGAWQTVPNNGMSDRAAAYQMQIAGSAPDQAFVVANVRFDGYNGAALLEAKGPGYAQFVGSNGQFEPWFEGSQNLVDQARSQLSVANGAPIEWHIAEPEAFTAIQKIFSANNIWRINLVLTPARP